MNQNKLMVIIVVTLTKQKLYSLTKNLNEFLVLNERISLPFTGDSPRVRYLKFYKIYLNKQTKNRITRCKSIFILSVLRISCIINDTGRERHQMAKKG